VPSFLSGGADNGLGSTTPLEQAAVQRLTVLLSVMRLLLNSSVSDAKRRKSVRENHEYRAPTQQSPESELERMKKLEKMWPGRAICDEGGYRLRPCDVNSPSPR
jgi:hypothetical protein